MQAPAEELAYVAVLNPNGDGPDAMAVMDVNPTSPTYGQVVGRMDMPNKGDELHHFGWNACSAALCPTMPHPHLERRYLIVPGLRSSRIYVLDTKPDPRSLKLVKTIEPETLHQKSGYSRPHTVHCGPDDLYMGALGTPDGGVPQPQQTIRQSSQHRGAILTAAPGRPPAAPNSNCRQTKRPATSHRDAASEEKEYATVLEARRRTA